MKLTRREFLKTIATTALSIWAMDEGLLAEEKKEIPKRKLGKMGVETSIIGIGCFHLIEKTEEEAVNLLNYIIDEGVNYVDVAPSYGDAELKVGKVMRKRRNEVFLATKTHERTKRGTQQLLEQSLKRLQTDHIDLVQLHGVSSWEDLGMVFEPFGAIAALEEARRKGLIRFIGISSHRPDILFKAIKLYNFDSILVWVNYLDRFNYPIIHEEILPYARKNGIAIIAMKAVGDGLLRDSARMAIRYALTHSDVAVLGMNTIAQAKLDIDVAKRFKPLTKEEEERWFKIAPELGNFVCRQCGKCLPCPVGIDIPKVFLVEGAFDRQVIDGVDRGKEENQWRYTLAHWYGNERWAKMLYEDLAVKPTACVKCGQCEERCPYKIPVMQRIESIAKKIEEYKP
ncbi:aldo/keto reductase [bacterium]|nr:aldo/keto reductase [bacterium]